MHKRPVSQQIVITGDVTIDWHFARVERGQYSSATWDFDDCTFAYRQLGGASLLADLIAQVVRIAQDSSIPQWSLHTAGKLDSVVTPGDPRFTHTYALWTAHKEKDGGTAWRVAKFLGHSQRPRPDEGYEPETAATVQVDPTIAQLVVLDDAGFGFRDRPELWPRSVSADMATTDPSWIILKMSYPVAQGKLWDYVVDRHRERLIVILSASDLRRTEVQISQRLSWERTAQDVYWELAYNPRVRSLAQCAHVIVSFGPAGAVWFSRHGPSEAGDTETRAKGLLVFDPAGIEGEWEQQYSGGMLGYNTCLTAAVAYQVMANQVEPDLAGGIHSGLSAMRRLLTVGYGQPTADAGHANLMFPHEKIAQQIHSPSVRFGQAVIQDPMQFARGSNAPDQTARSTGHKSRHASFWSILQDLYPDQKLHSIAERIVREGPMSVLRDVPIGRFGNLLTVDRLEVESFRSIGALISEYCRPPRSSKPLSVAVFGTPGSGKSFGVTELAKSLLPGQVQILEFNLSQFDAADDLLAAFHQVRDVGLSGKIPLVFWDEFDTQLGGQPLGWLRYFLSPMQDGRFQEGQITHPLGSAVYVFVGSTCDRLSTFNKGLADPMFRAAKGPDFVSRLKGTLNILGPNRQDDATRGEDPYFIIRRAIILRSLLQRKAGHLLDGKLVRIDAGVLRAFLETQTYRHGIRSMESIVLMSTLAEASEYARSCLPPQSQLDLHVNGQDFLALVQQLQLSGNVLETMARLNHERFCAELIKQEYRHGSETDAEVKTHSSLRPYAELPAHEQRQNKDAVRHIPEKLAAAGYVMWPSRSDEPPFDFPGADLERLARLEHQRWIALKLADGWEYAPVTDKTAKRHASLLPWEELPDQEKEKDRQMVRSIPALLARVGYTIVKAKS